MEAADVCAVALGGGFELELDESGKPKQIGFPQGERATYYRSLFPQKEHCGTIMRQLFAGLRGLEEDAISGVWVVDGPTFQVCINPSGDGDWLIQQEDAVNSRAAVARKGRS